MTTNEKTKNLAYSLLAQNRYARKPKEISAHQWNAVKGIMEKRFTREYMDTPQGLYTDEQIWKQTFLHIVKVEDVDLMKGNYNTGDTLTWTYKGEEYSCTGEFYVDKDNNLHHTFIAPTGEEIEIMTPYE